MLLVSDYQRYFFIFVLYIACLFGSSPAMAQLSPTQFYKERQLKEGALRSSVHAYGESIYTYGTYEEEGKADFLREEATFQRLLAAAKLGVENSEKDLLAYTEANGESVFANEAYIEMGKMAFARKAWEKTVFYLSKAKTARLETNAAGEVEFKHAYALLSLKEFDKARKGFDRAKQGSHSYVSAAYYYASYLNTRESRYAEALADLARAEADPAYKGLAPLMRANIYYKQGNYDMVLQETSLIEKNTETSRLAGMEDASLLSAEAFYMKGDFAAAQRGYTAYLGKNKGAGGRALNYHIGYTAYQLAQYDKAIPSLVLAAQGADTAAGKADTLSQMASYFVGNSFLKQGNVQFALNAFTQAKQTRGSAAVAQRALLAAGKCLFELERYDGALQAMQEYKTKYPDADDETEADEVIGESYLNNGNYEVALDYIQKIKKKTPRVMLAFQRVTFQNGLKLFNADSTAAAAKFFLKSQEFPEDKKVYLSALYWGGESLSAEGKWAEAQGQYAKFFAQDGAEASPLYAKARYGLGYSYFNQQQYDKALPHFKFFVEKLDKSSTSAFIHTAILRLGDSYYATKDYSAALSTYDAAIAKRNPEIDYALYQKGLCQSALGQMDAAATTLQSLASTYPKSRYRDEAAYTRAQINLDQGNYTEAAALFSEVIRFNPEGSVAPFAHLKRAVAYSNAKDYPKASADYKLILDKFSTSEASESAIVGLQESLNN